MYEARGKSKRLSCYKRSPEPWKRYDFQKSVSRLFSLLRMFSFLLAAAPLASLVSASFDGNLNYHSPSRRHEGLGIDISKVAKRTLVKRATPWDPAQLNFTHGVASGDPLPDSVILWTRIAPSLEHDRSNVTVTGNVAFYNHETEKYITASPNPICVEYRVATDRNFTTVADRGTAYTTSDIDFTVKVGPSP